MGKMLVTDVAKCTGCGWCELACSFRHHDEFNPTKSRIHKITFWQKAIIVPVVCQQCEEPWCGRICQAGAITTKKDEKTGATLVEVAAEKCVGCRMCMLACPYGCIIVSDEGTAEKCDLCGGDPECVKFCAAGAIKFTEAEAAIMARKKSVAERLLTSHRE